jgi:hypothetical protein
MRLIKAGVVVPQCALQCNRQATASLLLFAAGPIDSISGGRATLRKGKIALYSRSMNPSFVQLFRKPRA